MVLRQDDFFGSPRYRHVQFRELIISQNHKEGAPSSVCWFITPLSADVSTINPSWCTCTIVYSILLCLDWPCFIAIFDLHQASPSLAYASVRRPAMAHMKQPLAKLGLGRLLVRKNGRGSEPRNSSKLVLENDQIEGYMGHGHPIFEQHRFVYSAKTWGKRLQNNKRKNRSTKNASTTYQLAYIQFF